MGFGDDLLKKLTRRGSGATERSQLGMVFADDTLAALELNVSAAGCRIENYAEIPCHGDREAALVSLVENHGWRGRRAQVCLPLFDYQAMLVERPAGVDDQELRNSLAWTLREELDERPENVVFDICPGPSSPDGIERLLAVNMSRSGLSRITDMFAAAAVVLDGVDIAPLCVGRALQSAVPDDGHLVMLHMESKAGSVFIYGQGDYHHAKRLPRGLQWISESRADADQALLMVNDLAVVLRRSADEYRREHGWLPDDLAVLLPPLPEFGEELVGSLQEALGWPVKVFDLRAHYEISDQVGVLGPGALMALGAAL